MTELSPGAEARHMELAATRARLRSWTPSSWRSSTSPALPRKRKSNCAPIIGAPQRRSESGRYGRKNTWQGTMPCQVFFLILQKWPSAR